MCKAVLKHLFVIFCLWFLEREREREKGRECVPLVLSVPSDGFDARRNSEGMFSLFFCRKELQPRHFSLTLLRVFYQS